MLGDRGFRYREEQLFSSFPMDRKPRLHVFQSRCEKMRWIGTTNPNSKEPKMSSNHQQTTQSQPSRIFSILPTYHHFSFPTSNKLEFPPVPKHRTGSLSKRSIATVRKYQLSFSNKFIFRPKLRRDGEKRMT